MSTITSISPTSGKVGTSVSISGSGFGAKQGSGRVTVGNQDAVVASWTDTSIGITVPTLEAGAHDVVVNIHREASNPSSFNVTT